MSPADLEAFFNEGVFSFILTFVRIGSAFLLMPGPGDAFIPTRIRLLLALAITFVLTPIIGPPIPDPAPQALELLTYIFSEFVIGLFIGGVARLFQTALSIGGSIISLEAGIRNAQLFNPALGGQGSLFGAFFSITGVALFMASNLHHMMILGIINSYTLFPFDALLPIGDIVDTFAKFFNEAFKIGFQISAPIVVVAFMIHMVAGILARVIPQIQAFILVLPLQILVAIITLSFIISTIFLFWLNQFEAGMTFLFTGGG